MLRVEMILTRPRAWFIKFYYYYLLLLITHLTSREIRFPHFLFATNDKLTTLARQRKTNLLSCNSEKHDGWPCCQVSVHIGE